MTRRSRMPGGFRTRLIVTVIGLVAVTAVLLAGLSYVLVGRSLRTQLVDDAVSRAGFNIGVLAGPEILAVDADRSAYVDSGLTERFLLRGTTGVIVEFPGDPEPFLSSSALVGAPDLMAPELRALVEDGAYGYQFLDIDGEPSLVVAGRRPPTGPDFYFVSSAEEIDQALTQLGRVLTGAGVAVVAIGALVAGLVARGVLRPVREAAEGAQRMAGGELGVRLPAAPGDDEFSRWTESFNAMAASLEQKIAEMEEARSREQRFVADVSHELRTPLTGLVNEAAMAAAHLENQPAEARRIGELLVADVTRLRRLVEDLLEISRLESAPTPLDESDIDIAAFVSAVVADRHPGAVVRIAPGSARTARIDRRALERILGNLLDNATAHAPGSPVHVEASVVDDVLAVDVADEGPGIPEEDLTRIFDRMAMVDASRQGGTGLGLAIADRHATRLGGSLTAHNRVGGGTVFELRVPVTESLHGGDPDETPPAHPETVDL